jgi:hypothetical protein
MSLIKTERGRQIFLGTLHFDAAFNYARWLTNSDADLRNTAL